MKSTTQFRRSWTLLDPDLLHREAYAVLMKHLLHVASLFPGGQLPRNYLVMDVETSGVSVERDCTKVIHHAEDWLVRDVFVELVCIVGQ